MPIKLTKTETVVFNEAMMGGSTKQIGNALGFHHKQATRHLGNIYRKKNVLNRTELMAQEIMRVNNRVRELEQRFDDIMHY
tara:strand:+ start:909 stop:1151 length:243 start_codon:yes stop_codon:yes gene_type:complete